MTIDISSTLMEAADKYSTDYQIAISKGDLKNAKNNAHKCVFIFKKLAARFPHHPKSFQKKFKEWENIESSLKESILKEDSSKPHLNLGEKKELRSVLNEINELWWQHQIPDNSDIQLPVINAVFNVALEIAREGREGRHVGTAFLIGDVDTVLEHSRQLILNPFHGHKDEDRNVTNADMKECIKELAQLDGAFIIRGNGIIEAAARYITIDTSAVNIPPGHGTRHSSIAAITQETKSIGIIVSQSGGKISIVKEGKIIETIHP